MIELDVEEKTCRDTPRNCAACIYGKKFLSG